MTDKVYFFDFTRLKMPDFIRCLYVIQHINEPESYVFFLSLIEKTCIGFENIPLLEADSLSEAFIRELGAYLQSVRSLSTFLDDLEESNGSEK